MIISAFIFLIWVRSSDPFLEARAEINFVGFLVQMRTRKFAFEIIGLLKSIHLIDNLVIINWENGANFDVLLCTSFENYSMFMIISSCSLELLCLPIVLIPVAKIRLADQSITKLDSVFCLLQMLTTVKVRKHTAQLFYKLNLKERGH